MKKCASCGYWKRDGIDGICFVNPPSPTVMTMVLSEQSGEYATPPMTLVRPKTNPDDIACMYHIPRPKIEAVNSNP